MVKKKRFMDRTPIEKGLIGSILLISLTIVGLAERDLARRSGADVRGPKLAWRLASLNALGALAYLGFGRR